MENKILKIDTAGALKTHVIKPYELYNLVEENNPILMEKMPDFNFDNPPVNPIYLSNSLFETMFHLKGLGLSAPQVGLRYRVFVVGGDKNNKQVFFNPYIVETDVTDKDVAIEGCLSYPNLFLKVKRPKWVTLEYQHVNGEFKKETFTGMTARVVLHEYDHMEGITFIGHVGGVSLAMAKDKRRKLEKKLVRAK